MTRKPGDLPVKGCLLRFRWKGVGRPKACFGEMPRPKIGASLVVRRSWRFIQGWKSPRRVGNDQAQAKGKGVHGQVESGACGEVSAWGTRTTRGKRESISRHQDSKFGGHDLEVMMWT